MIYRLKMKTLLVGKKNEQVEKIVTNTYICNICGEKNFLREEDCLGVPGPICSGCGSSVRFRRIAHVVTTGVFGGPEELFLHGENKLRGIGLSDAFSYAKMLVKQPYYNNTFYHKEPNLDVMQDNNTYHELDYLISSDVFEHTPPPAETPFSVVYGLLKLGGKFILSVPTIENYIEHFPDLSDYEIIAVEGGFILVNATKSGQLQVFRKLRFHGGPGSTLEMRIYSIDTVECNLQQAGFSSWEQIDLERYDFGIVNVNGLSTVWLATK